MSAIASLQPGQWFATTAARRTVVAAIERLRRAEVKAGRPAPEIRCYRAHDGRLIVIHGRPPEPPSDIEVHHGPPPACSMSHVSLRRRLERAIRLCADHGGGWFATPGGCPPSTVAQTLSRIRRAGRMAGCAIRLHRSIVTVAKPSESQNP